MGKMADSTLRARLRKEMEAVRAWEVFRTPSYVKLMGSIARELTDGRIERVQLFCAPKEPHMGWCDGRQVAVNYGNSVTESFLTLVQKNISLAGILGHECGHKNVSILVNLCAQDALSGRINNWDNAEGELLETFQELMPVIEAGCDSEGKSGRFLAVNQALLKIWKYLYRIIQKMEAQRQDEDSAREKEEDQEDGNDSQEEEKDADENGGGEQKSSQTCFGDKAGVVPQDCESAQADRGGDANSSTKSAGNGSERENSAKESGKGDDNTPSQEAGENAKTGGVSQAMQEYLKHLAGRMPKFVQEEKTEKAFEGFPDDVRWSGVREPEASEADRSETEHPETPGMNDRDKEKTSEAEEGKASPAGEEKQVSVIPVKLVDVDGPLQELLHQIAQTRVEEQMNRELNAQLQLEMDSLGFEAGHKQVQKRICRAYQITEQQKKQYQQYEEQVKQGQKRLMSAILPILENQGMRTERRLGEMVLKGHKSLQHCLDFILGKAYEIATEQAKQKGLDRVAANTGIALTQNEVFPWAEEYYRSDDEEAVKKKEKEEKERIREEWERREGGVKTAVSGTKKSAGKAKKKADKTEKETSRKSNEGDRGPEKEIDEGDEGTGKKSRRSEDGVDKSGSSSDARKATAEMAGTRKTRKSETSGQLSLFDLAG